MNRTKSGIEEIHTEKEDLLQTICDLKQQFHHNNKEECNQDSLVKGHIDRDLWAIRHDHGYARPSRVRAKRSPSKKEILDYLRSKHDKQIEMRNRKLQSEERKIALEERIIALAERRFLLYKQKLSAEIAERQVRWQMEWERHEAELPERKQLLQKFEYQQRLLEKLLPRK